MSGNKPVTIGKIVHYVQTDNDYALLHCLTKDQILEYGFRCVPPILPTVNNKKAVKMYKKCLLWRLGVIPRTALQKMYFKDFFSYDRLSLYNEQAWSLFWLYKTCCAFTREDVLDCAYNVGFYSRTWNRNSKASQIEILKDLALDNFPEYKDNELVRLLF